MLLRLADDETNSAVARGHRVSRPIVSLWRKRFAAPGSDGLHNDLKLARPHSTTEDEVATLINTTLSRKPSARPRCPQCALADETGLSKSTEHSDLTPFGPLPDRSKIFKLSNDPFFIATVRDLVGLYLNPPDHALVQCVGEKSQCQALEHAQRLLPMGLGYFAGIADDYVRRGITTLFAALDVPTAPRTCSASPSMAIRSSLRSCGTSKLASLSISTCI